MEGLSKKEKGLMAMDNSVMINIMEKIQKIFFKNKIKKQIGVKVTSLEVLTITDTSSTDLQNLICQ